MEKLISRWNREKSEAAEKARVFDVEERDDCLILTKRLSPFLGQAYGGAVAALLSMIVNWHIFQSPTNHGTSIGWVILWMLIGPAMAFFAIRRAWKVRQGDVWVLNRKNGQLEHNADIMVPLAQLRCVLSTQSGTRDGSVSRLCVSYQQGRTLLLDSSGMHEEHQRVGQHIADFLGVRFNPPYW